MFRKFIIIYSFLLNNISIANPVRVDEYLPDYDVITTGVYDADSRTETINFFVNEGTADSCRSCENDLRHFESEKRVSSSTAKELREYYRQVRQARRNGNEDKLRQLSKKSFEMHNKHLKQMYEKFGFQYQNVNGRYVIKEPENGIGYSSDTLYYGGFEFGKRSGFGVYKNGDTQYKGMWRNGNKDGLGTYENKDIIYSGEFKNDLYDGYGVLKEKNTKSWYQGEFQGQLYSGQGYLYQENKDGTKAQIKSGQFLNSQLNGFGKISNINNNDVTEIEGIFKKDIAREFYSYKNSNSKTIFTNEDYIAYEEGRLSEVKIDSLKYTFTSEGKRDFESLDLSEVASRINLFDLEDKLLKRYKEYEKFETLDTVFGSEDEIRKLSNYLTYQKNIVNQSLQNGSGLLAEAQINSLLSLIEHSLGHDGVIEMTSNFKGYVIQSKINSAAPLQDHLDNAYMELTAYNANAPESKYIDKLVEVSKMSTNERVSEVYKYFKNRTSNEFVALEFSKRLIGQLNMSDQFSDDEFTIYKQLLKNDYYPSVALDKVHSLKENNYFEKDEVGNSISEAIAKTYKYLDEQDYNEEIFLPKNNEQAAEVLNKVIQTSKRSKEIKVQDKFKKSSAGLLREALSLLVNGKLKASRELIAIADAILDIGLGLVPVISEIRDLYELVSGLNIVTGEALSDNDKAIAMIGVLTLGGVHYVQAGMRVVKDLEIASKVIDHGSDILAVATKLGIKTKEGLKKYGKLHNLLENLPNGVKVKRIREGFGETKIAIIGRKMNGVVDDTAKYLKEMGLDHVETFSDDIAWMELLEYQKDYNQLNRLPEKTLLPLNEVLKTNLYRKNKDWAKKLKSEGYTVLDLGDPKNATYGAIDKVSEGMSAFYSIEKKILFGE